MENNLTKNIPSWFVCDWFYAFFVINAVVGALLLIAILFAAVSYSSIFKGPMGIQTFTSILTLVVATTNMLFFYIMCNRSLLAAK
jgi:hypothetical protein